MGYTTPTTSNKLASIHRMLAQGPPNSGKTGTFCQTWPEPAHILVAPGERGDATVPRGKPGLTPYIWEESPIEKMASSVVVAEVEALTFKILGSPDVRSFCFDGLHKYYGYVLDWISGGSLFKGENIGNPEDPYLSARIYNRTREHVRYFVQRINASPIENILFTCWDGREPDKASQGFKGTQHIYPNLPGAAAKEIMGEFGLVVYTTIEWGQRQPKGLAPSSFQLLPEGEVWGCCVKAPIEVIKHLPVRCAQSYPVLDKVLADAWAASQQKDIK